MYFSINHRNNFKNLGKQSGQSYVYPSRPRKNEVARKRRQIGRASSWVSRRDSFAFSQRLFIFDEIIPDQPLISYNCDIIFMQMGSLLLSQQLHDEPVLDVSMQSSLLSQYCSKTEKNEDLHILYKSVICSIIGFVLSNTLNACRNQLARGIY